MFGVSTTITPRVIAPFGVSISDGFTSGIVTPTVSMQMASYATCADQPKPTTVLGFSCNNGNGNDTIYFDVRGFETIQLQYSFNVQTFANDTGNHILVLRFVGIQPLKVIGSTITKASYDFSNRWEQVTFNPSATDPAFLIGYGSVSNNIGNAVTQGSALLIIIMLMVSIAFLIIIAFRVVPSDQEKSPLGQFILSPIGMIVIVLIFIVILALIASFTNYFSGIGL